MEEMCCCGLKVGQEVPDFKIDTFEPVRGDFGEVSLERLKADKRWTVLFFYPAAFTFVCATEFAALAEEYEKLKAYGAEVISVSTDSKFVQLAWQRDEKMLKDFKFPMGADPTGELSDMFGVYDEDTGFALRGTFIISPEGKLLNSEVNFYNLGRNIEEMVRKVKANIYLAEHANEGCPAKWQKQGDKTLKPSVGLVGKVYEDYVG